MLKKTLLFLTVLSTLIIAGCLIALPRTGQVTCYSGGNGINCQGTAQDGDIQAGLQWPSPRFTDNGNGTVADNLTGLIWLKNANRAGEMSWSDAVTYCNNLASGSSGLTDGSVTGDWRLPNVVELESLVNGQSSEPAQWLISQGFTNVQSSDYWSATTSAYDTSYAWVISMAYGYVSFDDKSPWSGMGFDDDSSGYGYYVWPVRAGQSGASGNSIILCKTWQTGQKTSYVTGDDGALKQGVAWPSPRFTDNNNGTVTDNLTGLVWLKDAGAVGNMTWSQALTSCRDLTSGTYGLTDGSVSGDWRLPNRKEMMSLFDYGRYDPALPQGHPFLNVNANDYWSSTTCACDANYAWVVRMFYGYVYYGIKSYYYNRVWPVRSVK